MSKISPLLEKVSGSAAPELADLETLLSLEDPREAEELFSFADQVRKRVCGDGIFLRGIVEFSNHCSRECFYCGLNKANTGLKRYRLSAEEILDAAGHISSCGVKTIVLQSGEDACLDAGWLASVISEIKTRFDLSVTVSVGERKSQDYRLWKEAGADRYLLKIETSDEELYSSLHPDMSFGRRLDCLKALKELGYQTGSGNIVGLKGQTLEHIARDILFFKEQALDMVGIGPFIPHSQTPLRNEASGPAFLTLKTLALTRIVCRDVHLPATTALGSLREDARPRALIAGANVLMPNFTPTAYRALYEIYPGKRCVDEPVGACSTCMETLAGSLGRFIDRSAGDSFKMRSVI